jgi:hypothetical protein
VKKSTASLLLLFALLGLARCYGPRVDPAATVQVRVRPTAPERTVERVYAVGRDSARAARVSTWPADSVAFSVPLNLAADSTAYVLISPTRALDTLTIFYRRQPAFDASRCQRDYYLAIIPPPAGEPVRAARGTVENVQFLRAGYSPQITLDYRP